MKLIFELIFSPEWKLGKVPNGERWVTHESRFNACRHWRPHKIFVSLLTFNPIVRTCNK